MSTLTCIYTSGKHPGETFLQQVPTDHLGFLYEVGASFCRPGVGSWVVLNMGV